MVRPDKKLPARNGYRRSRHVIALFTHGNRGTNLAFCGVNDSNVARKIHDVYLSIRTGRRSFVLPPSRQFPAPLDIPARLLNP